MDFVVSGMQPADGPMPALACRPALCELAWQFDLRLLRICRNEQTRKTAVAPWPEAKVAS